MDLCLSLPWYQVSSYSSAWQELEEQSSTLVKSEFDVPHSQKEGRRMIAL